MADAPPPPPPVLGPPGPEDLAAEKDFVALDKELRRDFDYETGHHRFKGTLDQVLKDYQAAIAKAKPLADRIDAIIAKHTSKHWTAVLLARKASVYDSVRTGLAECKAPALKLFSSKEEEILKKLKKSGDPNAYQKAGQFRDARNEMWRAKVDNEVASLELRIVEAYLQAALAAERVGLTHADVARARQRLAELERLRGAGKMAQLCATVAGFTYKPGVFQDTSAPLRRN